MVAFTRSMTILSVSVIPVFVTLISFLLINNPLGIKDPVEGLYGII